MQTLFIVTTCVLLVFFAVSAMMIRNLIKAALCLGFTSVMLTVILFYLKAPYAAAFELSVCAGLITVIFIGAISLTKPRTQAEITEKTRNRMKRFIYLPLILVVAAVLISILLWNKNYNLASPALTNPDSVKNVIWNSRHVDLLGQIVVILAGVFGIVILFKERRNK